MLKIFQSKKMIIIGSIVLLVAVEEAAGAMLMMKKKTASKTAEAVKGVDKEIVSDATGGKSQGETANSGGGEAKHGEGKGEAKQGEKPEEAAKKGPPTKRNLTYQFDRNFTVNLQDVPKGRWFVITAIQIETASPKAKEDVEDNVAPLRDAVIMLLSSKTSDEIQAVDGKDRLKRELLARFNSIVDPADIKNIYLDDIKVVRQ